MLLTQKNMLQQLRHLIPFLRQIPDDIYFQLDTSEFHIPNIHEIIEREELEKKIGHNIMTYNRKVFNLQIPLQKHLCANLAPAELSDKQWALLQEYEKMFASRNVSFVAYKNPLTIINPKESAIYSLYKSKELLVEYSKLL